jgi:hypothetical protein
MRWGRVVPWCRFERLSRDWNGLPESSKMVSYENQARSQFEVRTGQDPLIHIYPRTRGTLGQTRLASLL